MKLDLEQIKAAALAAPTTKPVPEFICSNYDPVEAREEGEAEGWNECHAAMTTAANPAVVLELVRQLELERSVRLQCADDSQRHLNRALAAEAAIQALPKRTFDLADLKRRLLLAQQRLTELPTQENVTTSFSTTPELMLALVERVERAEAGKR